EDLPFAGYHELRLVDRAGRTRGTARLLVAPPRCYRPPALEERRLWGPTVQLYSVRSERNWGIGDFTDLQRIVELWGRHGADIVGVNPLHALFPHNPRHASPYSPSSRLFHNVLYLDVEAIEEYAHCEEARTKVRSSAFQERLASLRHAPLVDYAGVRAAKFEIFELLFACLQKHGPGLQTRRGEFEAFIAAGGTALREHALFEAVQEHLHAADSSIWGWPVWPRELQDPGSPAIARLAGRLADRVAFYQYLQWQVELQLRAVAQRGAQARLAVGLYKDLAVSIDRAGAEAWSNRSIYAIDLRVGAPPDDFNPMGQDWGLPPWNPDALRASGHAPFIALMQANMRHAGALRIDHVMALVRLYLIPPHAAATQGAYVHYPLEELLAIVAIESHRNECVVIGEDLGTVPDVVRSALARYGVLSYRLLYFERQEGGAFRSPADYPAEALVAVSTHDLPTLTGWWEDNDIGVRESLALFPNEEFGRAQRRARAHDREQLVRALAREQLLPEVAAAAPDLGTTRPMHLSLAAAIHAYIARSRSMLAVLQLEDMLGAREQANLPGTTDQHPNWLRRLTLPLEHWEKDARFRAIVAAFRSERRTERAAPARKSALGARGTVIPRATYRLQLNRDMTFRQATALVPYLADLGISHVYCSPYLRARAGSQHGYDIIDHHSLNPEIGTRTDFDRFVATLRAHGMGQVADIVPNHMGVLKADNAWWLDVLENGPASEYAHYFDIDWDPLDSALRGKVLLPVLGDHYGRVLERGEFRLDFDAAAGTISVRYYEHRFPLDPNTYAPLLVAAAQEGGSETTLSGTARSELLSIAEALRELPARDVSDAARLRERRHGKETLKHRLAALVATHTPAGVAIERTCAAYNADGNGDRGAAGSRGQPSPARIDELHNLLEAQAYRLASWRVAADEINYRRFFDINDLAALRTEEEEVFGATHAAILEWAASGAVDGLRVDHPDGLFDPGQYFARLQSGFVRAAGLSESERNARDPQRPLYVVIEKILASHEELAESWPVHGTTGYRFATLINGLFVDITAEGRVDRTWRAFVGDEARDYPEIAYQARREVMVSALAGEMTVLANRLLRLARADRRTRDFTLNTLRQALATVVASFPVYRTYIVDQPSKQDRRYIDWAVGQARRRSRAADVSIFAFVRDALLARARGGPREEALTFAQRFQQFTAPVAAKGIEDTAFYRFNRLLSLNDVGGNPTEFGMSVTAFHAASADRRERWPHTVLATTTHDSKRSEDVRARLNVIAEMPAAWRLMVRRWSRMNRRHKRVVDGVPAPSRNDEYALYQLIAATCPRHEFDDEELAHWRGRMHKVALKSAREAKLRTSWIAENEAYETALRGFIDGMLTRPQGTLFLDDLRANMAPMAWYGLLNSVSMALIKFTSPGVPDVYQGNELLALRLVDPDNRAPIDFTVYREALAQMHRLADRLQEVPDAVRGLFEGEGAERGVAKLWVTWRALQLRQQRRRLFEGGEYLPLPVRGERSAHVVAFARRAGEEISVTVAGRLFAAMTPVGALPFGAAAWSDTTVDLSALGPLSNAADVLSGQRVVIDDGQLALRAVWKAFPGSLILADATREAA
ncbi:MAG TPA: malto-oligosyltrehalose synthase, partial [Burkholderiaceae bacterium]|nr:malto-oligosyltrehalose synthase [Burkholderiaceae bacterium]